jgi:two-component sensor histidine kinase
MIAGPLVFGQSDPGINTTEYTITKRLLSIEDGLASHEVFCGLQDRAGFMWFGTRNGLNRLDGKNCLLFTRQRNNLQDNKVVQLAKDDADHLFIEYGSTGFQLTTNGKVDVMNTVTREVRTLTAAFPDLPFKEQDVYWISNDGSDEINFLTAYPYRLWKYSSKYGFKLRYQINDWGRQDSLPFADYRSTGPFCLFAKGKALVKSFNQWTQYLISNDTVITFTQKDALRSLPLGFNSQNDLLITYNTATEVNAFNVGAVTHTGNSLFPANLKQNSTDSIKGRYWYQVACAADGSSSILYIPTDALYLWNENALIRVVLRSEIRSFENLFLYQLVPDNLGNLWLCSSLGVLQLKIEKNRFRQYFTNKQQSVEKNSQVRGIYADGTGKVVSNVWMHTFLQQGGNMQGTGDAEIKYAVAGHGSSLYCGGYSLFRYDESKNTLSKCPGGEGSEIWSMFSLNDSLLLLGRSNGFLLYNSNRSAFDSLLYASRNMPEAKFVYRIFKDGRDTTWAVAENGLYKIIDDHRGPATGNPRKLIVKCQSPFLDKLILMDAFADANGVFWFATNGEGLFRWDRKANSFQQFNIASGLPSDVLYRIEPDEYNNLWISSDYGLARFNKKTFSVNTYTVADGISHNEFNRTSSFKGPDGQLFFGGLDGVNAFNPGKFITDTSSLNVPLRVISFNQFVGEQNRLVDKTSELLTTSQIVLSPADQFFTLEFRLLDFAKEEAHRYAYKIEGIDKDWNYIEENSIRISGLPYGKFTLRIKAQNREGAWSRSELNILVQVLRPFYLKWWFICLAAVLFAIAVYSLIKFRTKQLAADKSKLEQTVNERTIQLKRSLSEQAELLAEKDVLIKEIHHRVKNNLQVISGLLELQSKNLSDEAAKEALLEGRNRVRSIALIHQNLYQIEGLSGIELRRFAEDLCRQVEGVYKQQSAIRMNINVPVLYLDIDSAIPIGMIMSELLSNSFKYAFKDGAPGDGVPGEINLEIHPLGEGTYELMYSDNGPGLPKDFDLHRATTLGMQLINDLSRQIGGKVKYEYNKGASFIITFTNRNLRKNQD